VIAEDGFWLMRSITPTRRQPILELLYSCSPIQKGSIALA
jgi:hypothetical protein